MIAAFVSVASAMDEYGYGHDGGHYEHGGYGHGGYGHHEVRIKHVPYPVIKKGNICAKNAAKQCLI